MRPALSSFRETGSRRRRRTGNAPRGRQLSEANDLQGVGATAHAPAGIKKRFFSGLRGRVLLLTSGFVFFAITLTYPVLAAGFRTTWLLQRGQAAQIAALAVEAAPDGRVSEELSRQLLESAQVVSVAVQAKDFRGEILPPAIDIGGDLIPIDMRNQSLIDGVVGVFDHLLAPRGRFLRVIVEPTLTRDETMEVIVPEAALKRALIVFSRTLLVFSILVAALVGGLVYFAIYRLVVRPMDRLTDGIVRFANSPEDEDIAPMPGGSDEMHRANLALQSMQKTVSAAFRQRKRLAELGEAVAKINHDLRNSLAAAQIVSEGLSQSEDPRVKRAAPRLERAIQRAVNLAEATLSHARAEPAAPNLGQVNLVAAMDEAALEGLAGCVDVAWSLEARGPVMAVADVDHVHRIVANLVRNAGRAIGEQKGRTSKGQITARVFREGADAIVEIADNGPGVPANIATRLFQPFAGSGSRGGAGLGLAIARELARGMKGDLEMTKNDPCGAVFRLRVPAVA